jgi:quercetin dioxygenase-like cupin family protein
MLAAAHPVSLEYLVPRNGMMACMNDMAQSKVFRFADMPTRKMANGGESRDVVRGTLPTGEIVAVHESMRVAGMTPNPMHRIDHSEIIMVQEGTVEFKRDDNTESGGPGTVFYVPKGTNHSVRNIGDGPAKYFVVAVGGDVKPST